MNIVVTGSIAFDYLMSFPGRFTDHLIEGQLEKVSLSFLVDGLKRQRGGTGPNIAYTLALLGGQPKLMGTAGQDFSEFQLWLEEQGVDTSGVRVYQEDYTASFFANTDLDLNQIASFYTGAMARASDLTFADIAPDVDLAIISPNDPTAMHNYAAECRERSISFIYDPSQQTVRMSGEELLEGLSGCRFLTVNEYEFGLILDKTGCAEIDILERIGGLLITRGHEGSILVKDGERIVVPAVEPDRIVEPTGAGDAYRAGLMRGLQLDLPLATAGRMGALAATYVLEQHGTMNHHFTPASFVKRYRKHFDDDGGLDILLED